MRKLIFRRPAAKDVLFFVLLGAAMALFNVALPQREPLSFCLLFAALMCGRDPFLCAGVYMLASAAAVSGEASLCCAAQAAFLLVVFALYRRFRRQPRWERIFYALAAQLPFVFLYPHAGYAIVPFPVVAQKAVLAAFFVPAALLTEGGMRALLQRAFRCRLSAGELAELCLMWLFLGMGIFSAASRYAFYALSLLLLLCAAVLLKSAACVPFAMALSLPACFAEVSALPAAAYAAFACCALPGTGYGRIVTALLYACSCLVALFLNGVFYAGGTELLFSLLSGLLPAAVVCAIPDKAFRKLRATLLFYRERTLPRIAINRNRRAVGEQLYEVSALFREIECAFRVQERPDDADAHLRARLNDTLCSRCAERDACKKRGLSESLDRLIRVGRAKGKVNLIDLPADLGNACKNVAGLLFALNKALAEYRGCAAELDAAQEGRRLLAEQAHGVSEILKELALEQSRAYTCSGEGAALSRALQERGLLSSEIFLYGEDDDLTVSMTLDAASDARAVCDVAGAVLHAPLALAEKIPLTRDRACFILRRKPHFDAAFGLAARAKEGEAASGDTHSILKIDERRFLVALSDGMGSGEPARDVSARTLSLLESFYKAKMPSETILSTVNRLIAFSADETFSCLDLAAVNLDTGCADIVKIGSPAGYLLSGEELKILEGESLPIGMLEAVHPATLRVTMKENDFLIFMSDGVTAAFGSSADLCAYLSELKPLNPQALAENILNRALQSARRQADDDMTVLTVKLTPAA